MFESNVGARGRNRTDTLSPARDFESRASTNSATRAFEDQHYCIIATSLL